MKRIISMLLALCLVIGLCPTYAGAAEDAPGKVRVIVENTTFLEPVTDFDGNTVSPAWTDTLLDTWVELAADSTVGSCVASAVTGEGHTITGADSGYISEIKGLKEFDGGTQSGWMVTVNDWFINAGVNDFSVSEGNLEAGDEIRMMYTCSMGEDLGGSFSSTDRRLTGLTFSVGELDATFDPDEYGYALTVPAGTTALTVTPTAMNKNYQVRIRLNDDTDTWYKRTDTIPVSNGTMIHVVCGHPDWPSMNASSGPSIYSIMVKMEEQPLYTKPAYGSFSISGDKISKDCGTSLPYSLYRDSAGTDEIVATQDTFDNLQFIPDNAASADAVEFYLQRGNNGGLLWGIDFVGFGSGKLVYTDTDGTIYSVAIESVLPERGFSTAPTLTKESFMKTGDSYTIGQPFYYVYPAGVTISSATFTADHNNAEVPNCVTSEQYSNNVWKFTITGDLDTYPQFYLHVTFHTDWEKDDGTAGWIMLYSGADGSLTRLGTPTDPVWGRIYNYSEDYVEHPGALSATVTQPTQNEYRWEVYRVADDGDDELIGVQGWDYGSDDVLTYIDDGFGFAKGYDYDAEGHTDDWCIPSGTYYFKVCAEGDGKNYQSSEAVTSDTWTYTKPEEHLAAPTGLYWDAEERIAHWTDSNGDGATWQFEVVWFFQEEDGTWQEVGADWGPFSACQDKLEDYVLARAGAGNYAFRVRALSPDITRICNSVWSELSPVLAVGATAEQVKELLDDVSTDYAKNDDGTLASGDDRDSLRQEIAEIGLDSLSTAMAADTGDSNGNGTVEKIKELEALVGGAAAVTVSDDVKIDANKVSIVGANLNTSGESTATLEIAPAETGEVIEEQYQNTLTFSMSLSNVDEDEATGHQQLTVPVQITIPVPDTINPDFLVILHHAQDGTTEEIILPRIYTEDGTTYAVFVITSFSDFTFAEQCYSFDDDGNMTVNAGAGVKQVLAAVYDGNGRMVVCVSADVAGGKAILAFPEDIAIDEDDTGAKLKVFYLDENHSPVTKALEIPLY